MQISKLRFFIALIIDQKDEPQAPNRNIIPLPNLELNFVSADSLYTLEKQYSLIPENANKLIEKLENLRFAYAWTHFKQDKEGVKYELIQVRQQIQQQLQRARFANSDLGKLFKWDLFNQNASAEVFDKFWMFGLTSGFDCVIGNPPYIRQEEIKEIKPTLERLGYVVYNSTSDIYTYFYEAGYHLLKSGGFLTFITSNKWLRAKYGTHLRRFLKKNTQIQEIVDFGGYQVFKSSIVDTCILRFQKKKSTEALIPFVNIGKDFENSQLSEYVSKKRQVISQEKLNESGWTLADDRILALKEKIEKMGTPLKDWDVKISYGIKTGLNEAFIIDTPTKDRLCAEDPKSAEILKPILRGRDIGRYWYEWKGLWIIAIESGWTNKNRRKETPETYFKRIYPAIHRHLKQIGDGIMSGEIIVKGKGLYQRDDQGDYWWELRPCEYYREFEGEKIVWQEISSEGTYTLDENKYFIPNTAYFLVGDHKKYLLGLLNSKILDFYFELLSSSLSEAGKRHIKQYIELLPIPKINFSNNQIIKKIENLVDYNLTLTKSNDYLKDISKKKHVIRSERQINLLAYKLFQLIFSEVKLIDPEFELTETEYENWQIDFDEKQSLEVTEKRPPAKSAGVEEQKEVG